MSATIDKIQALKIRSSSSAARSLCDELLMLLAQKHSNKLRPIIKAILKSKADKILDIGCGTGALSLFCALHGLEATGIDLNQAGLDLASETSKELDISGTSFISMDACAINLSGFSTCCSTDFFEHLSPADQIRHLNSVYEVLRPGGIYIIRTPHRANIRQQPASNHLDHIGLASHASLLHQAEDAGFQVCFGIAHFALVSPLNYHIPLEQLIEARILQHPFAAYKVLQKFGLANIVAHLRKPTITAMKLNGQTSLDGITSVS